MRAMVLRGTELTVEEVDVPKPGPMQVMAKVLACGICGSDLHAAKYMDDMVASSARSRRAGVDMPAPDMSKGIVMGHEFVAEVVEAGPGAEAWTPGTRVSSMPVLINPESPMGFASIGYSPDFPGAYGEYVIMSAPLLLRVPEGLPNDVAATCEPCAVGLHAVRMAKMQPGEHALVMGAGPIGLMTLLWLKHDGIKHVTVSDFAPARRELARQLGADLVVDPKDADVVDAVTEAVGAPPKVVFEAVGVEGTLQQAMEAVDRGGRVVVVGVCMKEDKIMPMVGINKQLTVQFVLGYTPEEYAETLTALGSEAIDTAPLITRRVTLDELPAAFESLADPSDCKIVFVA
jgi:2-desacetyl-2-hydroxyethyl bacteriochlorophyllide A dehydrogenase